MQAVLGELTYGAEAADRLRAEQRALQRRLAEAGAELTAAQVRHAGCFALLAGPVLDAMCRAAPTAACKRQGSLVVCAAAQQALALLSGPAVSSLLP